MIRLSTAIEINAPVSDVFSFVSTIENIPSWQSEVVTTRITSSGSLRAGTRFEEVVKIFGRNVPTICEITDYQPTKRFAFRSVTGGPVYYSGTFLLEPNGRGTRVTLSVETGLNGLWRVVEPLFGIDIRRGITQELKTLKSILEGQSDVSELLLQSHHPRGSEMKKVVVTLIFAAASLGISLEAVAQTKVTAPKKTAKQSFILLSYDQLRWQPFGEEFPGVEYAAAQGDPSKGPYAMYVRLAPGVKIPLHSHGNDEWGVIVSGRVIIGLEDGKEATLGVGSFVFSPKGVRHTTAAGPDGCVFLEFSNEKESTMMAEEEKR